VLRMCACGYMCVHVCQRASMRRACVCARADACVRSCVTYSSLGFNLNHSCSREHKHKYELIGRKTHGKVAPRTWVYAKPQLRVENSRRVPPRRALKPKPASNRNRLDVRWHPLVRDGWREHAVEAQFACGRIDWQEHARQHRLHVTRVDLVLVKAVDGITLTKSVFHSRIQ
jgi:hypothetical protein